MTFFNRVKRNTPKLFRFSIVGSLGTAVNIVIYYLTSVNMHLNVNISAFYAFSVAVSCNYLLNHLWTFKAENENNAVNVRQFIYYILSNINSLFISLAVLNIVVVFAGIDYHIWGQVSGILVGMSSNFFFAKKFVFKQHTANSHS